MSFVAGFYTFRITLNNVDEERYAKFHIKTPRHPEEPLEYLYARMLAYIHCYRPGQDFSEGRFEPKQPTIWHKDITGDLLLWADVGEPPIKKLEIALRAGPKCEYRVYFYAQEQIQNFCHHLRGSKSNWVDPIKFFLIPEDTIKSLALHTQSSSTWDTTEIDNHLYLVCDNLEFDTQLERIDIWSAYQKSIGNTAA